MLYAANICVPTKVNGRYDLVAVNKLPIIADCKDNEAFKTKLREATEQVSEILATETMYENARYYIRCYDYETGMITSMIIPVKDLNKLNFENTAK